MLIVVHRYFIQHLFSLHWKNGFPLRRSLLECVSSLINIHLPSRYSTLENWALGFPPSLSTWMPIVAHRHSSVVSLVYIGEMGAWVLSVALYLYALFVAIHPSSLVVSLHCKKGVRQTPDSDLAAQKPDIVLLLKFGRRCVTPLAVIFFLRQILRFFCVFLV
jgi:hypothetical protein